MISFAELNCIAVKAIKSKTRKHKKNCKLFEANSNHNQCFTNNDIVKWRKQNYLIWTQIIILMIDWSATATRKVIWRHILQIEI